MWQTQKEETRRQKTRLVLPRKPQLLGIIKSETDCLPKVLHVNCNLGKQVLLVPLSDEKREAQKGQICI